MWVDIRDKIMRATSGDDRLLGLGVAMGRISYFPIDLRRRPYNTRELPCECVMNAFNDFYARGNGVGGEWATGEETTNFWIQDQCPEFVRVWRIVLRGIESNTQKIYHWDSQDSADGVTLRSLLAV